MDTISFKFVPPCPDAQPLVRIIISGFDLIALLREHELPYAQSEGYPELAGSYIGMSRRELRDAERHFLGQPSNADLTEDERLVLLDCDCGNRGCWPLLCRIKVGESIVEWDSFQQVHRASKWDYSGFGPFSFDRAAYVAALRVLQSD